MKKYSFVFLSGFFVLMMHGSVNALQSWTPTDQEMPFLPQFCQDKFNKSDRDKSRKWSRKFGKAWQHMHHHCAGLNFINRANKSWSDKENKKFNLNRARTNFEYMVDHTDSSFSYLTDVYFQLGNVYKMQKDFTQAAVHYNKSIDLNKKYTKPYKALSDIFIKAGEFEKAIEVLERGLKHKPKSKSLNRRLSEAKKKLKEKQKNNSVDNKSKMKSDAAEEPNDKTEEKEN
ncbi:MAG: tetratricopeptide repeat protein [Gammaproteobacteria bacterium]|nr:tetratricopeptide repeat protein [Gammaproteobacteria bacterium]